MTQQLYFGTFMDFIDGVEGGYVDDPRGGPTYCGIRQGYFNSWTLAHGGQLMNVAMLADHPELIEAYYLTEYWLPTRVYDLLIAPAPALVIYDGGVNCGVDTAIKLMQQVIGTVADGRFGPVTLARYQQSFNEDGDQALATALIARRRQYYESLNDPVNFQGWMNRLARVEARCKTL